MSLFTQKMRMLTAVVLDGQSDAVVKALLEEGVMDFVHISELDKEQAGRLNAHKTSMNKSLVADLRGRCENLMKQGRIPLPSITKNDLAKMEAFDGQAARSLLDSLSDSLSSRREEQRSISQKLLSFQEMAGYIEEKKTDYLDIRHGDVGEGRKGEDLALRLAQYGILEKDGRGHYISISLKRDASAVNDAMDKFAWSEKPEEANASLSAATAILKERIGSLQKRSDEIAAEVEAEVGRHADELRKLWMTLRVSELSEHVESYFSYTRNTTLFSGWVPSSKAQEVESVIYEAAKGRCIIEWTEDSEVERDKIPTSVSSAKVLAPFERMVKNYGTPEYGSINPTPFTAAAYLCMFALMFADLGQGFILLLVGLIGSWLYRKNPTKPDGIISRYLCSLLIFLGPASMAGGLLFGSCFGFSLIPALWFNYDAVVEGEPVQGLIQDIYDILGITIKFGIVIIYLGLLLNWINLVRKKRYFELVFDKNGIVGGVMYALGIWFAWGFVASGYRTFPSSPFFAPVLVSCLALIVIKGPLEAVLKAREGHKESVGHVVMSTVMDFLVEVLEIFSGLLSNTLSFMRVAGLGIAHASLMSAFYQMADMPGNIIAKVLIMILGNLLVIVLEGLSAGIQSLRLNYYEFFTKYFTGHGVAFEPVGLRSRASAD